MVSIAQLVRASDCGSEGRGFDPHCSPRERGFAKREASLLLYMREKGAFFYDVELVIADFFVLL